MLQRRPGTEESYEATAVHHPPWRRTANDIGLAAE
jgi:hypothetical protein